MELINICAWDRESERAEEEEGRKRERDGGRGGGGGGGGIREIDRNREICPLL